MSRISIMPSEIVRNKSGYDLNSIFAFANILICASGAYIYCIKGNNQYVDGYTIVLLFIFGAQNLLILLYEKKSRDPFVLLLIAVAVFFYLLRVVTLLYDPWSAELFKYVFIPNDINYSLIFIMFSNASIFLGLTTAGRKIIYKKDALYEYPANSRNVIIMLLFTIGVYFYVSNTSDIIGRITGYITTTFINLNVIMLFTFVYMAVNYKKISKTNITILITLFIVFVIFSSLSGSRSGLLTLTQLLLIGLLSVKGNVTFSKKSILISVMLIPLSVILFISATYLRDINTDRLPVSTKQLTMLKGLSVFGSEEISLLCRPIFERAGFLDYSAALIRNRERYAKIINFPYYFESIIDNVLTPGYDIFDTPRVSHSISYISRNEPIPTHEDVTTQYQSDMPTVYGEYYVLFLGYPALIILFFLSYVFKKVYLLIRSNDTLLFYIYRALILSVFYWWINSFGIDWIMFDLVGIIITVGLFKNIYIMRRRKLKLVSWRALSP